MACHGGCHTSDILVKCGSIYVLLISPLFSKMADRSAFHSSELSILFLF